MVQIQNPNLSQPKRYLLLLLICLVRIPMNSARPGPKWVNVRRILVGCRKTVLYLAKN